MPSRSILFKLLSLMLGIFTLTSLSVLFVVDFKLSKMIDEDQSQIYADKLNVIWEGLNRIEERLQKTGKEDVYSSGFKASTLKDLRQVYYKHKNQQVYPFIVDAEYKIIMHPDLAVGHQFIPSNQKLNKLKQIGSGEFEFTHNGKQYWSVFKHFQLWGWVIVYAVPVEIKYLDAYKIRYMLMAVLGGISFLAMMLMWLMIRKVTNPINELIKGAKEVSKGNYSRKIEASGVREVDMLAHDFNEMAKAINEKIIDLNGEIETRKRAESDYNESEERYKHFFDNSLIGLLRSRISDGMIIDINSTAANYLGLPVEEIVGKLHTVDLYQDPEHRKVFLNQLKKNGVVSVYEAKLQFGNRDPVIASFSAKAYPNHDYIEVAVVDVSERKQAELNLHNSREFLDSVINGIADPIFVKDAEHKWLVVNDALCEMMGYTREELLGKSDYDFFPKDQADMFWDHDDRVLHSKDIDINEEELTAAGGMRTISTIKTSFINPMTDDPNLVGTIRDITEQKQIEKTLRRAQKMDAVGQLTGGIAHDFNNILGIILGNLGLLKHQVSENEKAVDRVEIIQKSAQRAADLTRQLLGFSQKRASRVEVVDINQLLKSLDNFIERSLTPKVEVAYLFAEDLWLIEIDPGDFQDALLNLVINARDAMSDGGRLTFETCNCSLDESNVLNIPGTVSGDYVQLSVSDNGEGIPKDIQDRIYEPFFTTKRLGKGTGLGLSMVYGFASRSGGSVKVYSEPGIGTTFRLYFPRVSKGIVVDKVSSESDEIIPQGKETLLVVDDEEDLLELAKESLLSLGYRVLTANNGNEALEILSSGQTIDLLFSDVVMPGGLNGYELADKAQQSYPQIKILLTSGYTQKVIAGDGYSRFDSMLLSKPYSQLGLAQKLRMLLDNDVGRVK